MIQSVAYMHYMYTLILYNMQTDCTDRDQHINSHAGENRSAIVTVKDI